MAAAPGLEPGLQMRESRICILPLNYTAVLRSSVPSRQPNALFTVLISVSFPNPYGETQKLTLNAGLAEVTGVEPAFVPCLDGLFCH